MDYSELHQLTIKTVADTYRQSTDEARFPTTFVLLMEWTGLPVCVLDLTA